jgi:mono/diheme cytochrome c family protein
MSKLETLALILAVSIFAGCELDPKTTKIQYMPDMADGPTVKAQEGFINPPDHSVPLNGILYPETVEESEKIFKNPIILTDDDQKQKVIAEGQKLYNTFCIPCHGADAKGEGSLGPNYPRPPDITTADYKKREDGFFFYRITFGAAIMPGYGHAISPNERWLIIHYLRTLQQ